MQTYNLFSDLPDTYFAVRTKEDGELRIARAVGNHFQLLINDFWADVAKKEWEARMHGLEDIEIIKEISIPKNLDNEALVKKPATKRTPHHPPEQILANTVPVRKEYETFYLQDRPELWYFWARINSQNVLFGPYSNHVETDAAKARVKKLNM